MNTRTSALNLITVKEPHSAAAEAYRRLRTNLEFAALTGKIETLVVAAPGPGEGATVTAANLAVVLAQANKRVILVDADLRHPSLHSLFGLPLEPGLTDMMRRPELLEEPPLQPASVLATRTDGVLLVLRAGKTRREQAARARARCRRVSSAAY